MTDAELLAKIKSGLGITTTYQDDTLRVYIDDVKAFMAGAGVNQSVIESPASVGCILRGVADLWNYGSGNATFSEYFRMRVIQLTTETGEVEATPNMEITIYIPDEDDETLGGWGSSSLGIYKQVSTREFSISDTENVKAILSCADGSVYTGENTGTGNRRNLTLGSHKFIFMPATAYDSAQAKFVDNDKSTVILCFAPPCYGATLKLSTFNKE